MARKPPSDSLAALAEAGRGYFVQCEACGHFKRLECYEVAKRLGWGATVNEILAAHRCKHCGKKAATIREE